MNDMTHAPIADWIGRTETTHGDVSASFAQMIHATLAMQGDAPLEGDPLPPLWHWYAFPPAVSMDMIGADGHPKLGGFLPPVPLPRRMWASGRLSFESTFHIGEALTRHSRIASVVEKEGTTGPMVFVTVEHEVHGAKGCGVRETQNIVYLDIAPEFTPPPKTSPPQDMLVLDQEVLVPETRLFRYSAITFNAHRIHFDLPYAQDVERYPGLVVHGPLQANLLLNAAMTLRGAPPSHFEFRGVHPVFHTDSLRLQATSARANQLDLVTTVEATHVGMTAIATWEE